MMLQGKKAFITGGSRGIGRAIVRSFLAQGAEVVYTTRGVAEEAEVLRDEFPGAKVSAVVCELTDEKSLTHAFSEAVSLMGDVNVLVNNAGITRDHLLLRMQPEDWDEVMQVNLRSAFLLSKLALRYLMRNQGVIINISSVVGITGHAGQANYAASKAGLISLTKSIAQEMGARNVRCNAIAPGFIATDMTAVLPQELREQYTRDIPLRRMGTAEEVGEVAVFLASQMSSYVNGQVISVCGGMNR